MKRDASRSKGAIIAVHSEKALSQQLLFLPYLLSGANRQMIAHVNQQANSVAYAAGMYAIAEAMPYTPPQVDKSACKKVSGKIRLEDAGAWRTSSALLTPSLHTLSSAKKASACDLAVNDTSIWFLDRAIVHQKDHSRFVRFAPSSTFLDKLTFIYLSLLLCYVVTDIQTYICPADMSWETDVQRLRYRIVFHKLAWSSKAGNPGKPAKPKPEKPKPEREGDKGKRKGKSPRTEEPMRKVAVSELLLAL